MLAFFWTSCSSQILCETARPFLQWYDKALLIFICRRPSGATIQCLCRLSASDVVCQEMTTTVAWYPFDNFLAIGPNQFYTFGPSQLWHCTHITCHGPCTLPTNLFSSTLNISGNFEAVCFIFLGGVIVHFKTLLTTLTNSALMHRGSQKRPCKTMPCTPCKAWLWWNCCRHTSRWTWQVNTLFHSPLLYTNSPHFLTWYFISLQLLL